MVECELWKFVYILLRICVLIDTWWNVNVQISCLMTTFNLVLIDTWWNVNNSIRERYTGGNSVLIDTWWNVNE